MLCRDLDMELGRITVIPDAHRTGKLYLYRELRMVPGMAPSEVISAQAAEDDLGQLSVTMTQAGQTPTTSPFPQERINPPLLETATGRR